MAILFSGPFCGANINPVITISNCLKKENKYKPRKAIWYLIAQIVGASAAISWSSFLGHKQLNPLVIDSSLDIFKIISNEAMGIFISFFFYFCFQIQIQPSLKASSLGIFLLPYFIILLIIRSSRRISY